MKSKEELEVLTDWEKLTEGVPQDRRKDKRFLLAFRVEVSGFDPNGRLFCERTVTHDICQAGCRILLKTAVAPGDVVAIRLLSQRREGAAPGRPLLFQVVWVARKEDSWTAGTLMLEQERFWNMAFPDKDNPPDTRS